MKPISGQRLLRRIVLPIFSRVNPGNIVMKHPYTRQPFLLHSFKHKGYWFHGANRERETMQGFAQLVRAGDTVVEVGGHIGYIALYFAHLVGEGGQVIVFEPGPNNLPYLLRNTEQQKNISVVPKAAGESEGQFPFYIEDLTGQNNTLVSDFEFFAPNVEHAYVNAKYTSVTVDVVTLDQFLPPLIKRVDFLKIDVEGAELQVLKGARAIIAKHTPKMMVESNQHADLLYDELSLHGYVIFSPAGEPIDPQRLTGIRNFFCLHAERHQEQIKQFVRSQANGV